MRKDHLYRVSFERHIDCKIDSLVFHCWAMNATEAKQIARTTWEARHRSSKRVPFMFHLEAHRADSQHVEGLRVTDWLQREFNGMDAMYAFWMIDTRTWRVNGRNLYGC